MCGIAGCIGVRDEATINKMLDTLGHRSPNDRGILIDTPAEINSQLNRADIQDVDYLIYSHLDPDHMEGFRIVEQITIDFRSWRAYPDKQIRLVMPDLLLERFRKIQTAYGAQLEYYEKQGFIKCIPFKHKISLGALVITALPVKRPDQTAYIYIFERGGRILVYVPCDVKPFPEENSVIHGADLFVIQPGIFETGLINEFAYPADHISRTTLYTFEETLALSCRIGAKQILFVHLEEYWNRSHTDYVALEKNYDHVNFAYDGMRVNV